MVKFKRLTEEERKAQIQEAGKKVFLEKGFQKTTMEDIISQSGMSKGGVYNYYKSTADILYDLMIEGTKYRFQVIRKILPNKGQPTEDILLESILDKLFDSNDFKTIYAILLLEMRYDSKLKQLYEKIKQESIDMIAQFMETINFPHCKGIFSEAFIAFVNSIILGVEILDAKKDFQSNREIFRIMLRAFLQQEMEKNDEEKQTKRDDSK